MSLEAVKTQIIDITEEDKERNRDKKPLDRVQALKEFITDDFSEEELDAIEEGRVNARDFKEALEKVRALEEDYGKVYRFRHRFVAYLAARGLKQKEIAETTGYDYISIRRILSTPWVIKAVLDFQDKAGAPSIEEAMAAESVLTRSTRQAVENVVEGLDSGDAKVRLECSKLVLDIVGITGKNKKNGDTPTHTTIINAIVSGHDKLKKAGQI